MAEAGRKPRPARPVGWCCANKTLVLPRRGLGVWRRESRAGEALGGSWTTMAFPELWKQQARMQRSVARGPI